MTLGANARDAWMRISPRERWLIALGTLLVVGAIGYAFGWEPVARDLVASRAALRDTQARIRQARDASDEIAGLAREARAPRTADARAAAEQVISSAGLRGELTAITAAEGRVRITFAAVEFARLAALLETLGREEQLFVVEALFAARVVPGSVRAELALARPPAR